jgi:uncharacterized protein
MHGTEQPARPQQPGRLWEISRGLRSAQRDDTPGPASPEEVHPEGVPEGFGGFRLFRHPFRVLVLFHRLTGGIAALNPRLISGTPSACWIWIALSLLFVATSPAPVCATGAPLADTSASPYAVVRPVGLDEVHWTTGFWADRFELCRTRMLPSLGRLMEGTNYSQYFRNFEIAAGLAEGGYRGAPFNDGDFYKLIEAACAAYAVTHDAYLERGIERSIGVIARAQRADGYLHTPVLIKQRNGDTNAAPFQDRNNFEMYNFGHLMTAACVHYRVTGRTNFLTVARKAADFLYATFHDAPPEVARSSVCPSHYMGILELYRTIRDPRYLELAKKFFALRSEIKDGGDDNQDRIPFEEQSQAVGHAVRANYLYAGAADLFMETGDTNAWRPLEPIWTNVVREKMYLTGGCGSLYDGASPDGAKNQRTITRVHQAYGRNYQLPNTTAYNETCANIGNVLWNWRMFLATGEPRFLDVLELALYNSVLSGVSLDGTNYFYTNPLRVTDPLPTDLRWSRSRVPYVSSFCCPPNLARTLAEAGSYAYAKSDRTIWVNLYGGSALSTDLAGVGKVKLTQETEYPWNGRVRIRVDECGTNEFALKLRIPDWVRTDDGARLSQPQPFRNNQDAAAETAALHINGRPILIPSVPGRYIDLKRVWQAGDCVDLDLPMPVRLMEANPLAEEDLNQLALQRGPVVYCLESLDLPRATKWLDILIPANIDLRARYDHRLLDGVVLLEGQALARSAADWNGQLYREIQPATPRPLQVRFIPYSVWGNRGPSQMTVWMPRSNP